MAKSLGDNGLMCECPAGRHNPCKTCSTLLYSHVGAEQGAAKRTFPNPPALCFTSLRTAALTLLKSLNTHCTSQHITTLHYTLHYTNLHNTTVHCIIILNTTIHHNSYCATLGPEPADPPVPNNASVLCPAVGGRSRLLQATPGSTLLYCGTLQNTIVFLLYFH